MRVVGCNTENRNVLMDGSCEDEDGRTYLTQTDQPSTDKFVNGSCEGRRT